MIDAIKEKIVKTAKRKRLNIKSNFFQFKSYLNMKWKRMVNIQQSVRIVVHVIACNQILVFIKKNFFGFV